MSRRIPGRLTIVLRFTAMPARTPYRAKLTHVTAAFICLSLFLLSSWSTVRGDSDHIQQSMQFMSSGNLAEAEKQARLAVRDPSTRALGWATLGTIRVRQKKYEEAITFLRTAVRLDPRLADARIALGEAYVLTGRKLQARGEFEQTLRADPENQKARFALAQLETADGKFSVSLRVAGPALAELHHSADGILLLAKDYAGLNQIEYLLELVPDWKALPEVSARVSQDFASLLSGRGLNRQALEVLDTAASNGKVSYELALALADLYLSTGDLSKAFSNYEAALTLKPDCIDCLRYLAKIASQQKDAERALAYLIKAKRMQPENPDVLFAFGKACLELELLNDAVPALERAAQLRPDNDSYIYVLGSAHVSKKEYDAALKLFQALLKKHPDDSVLNYAIGSVFFLEVKLADAAEYLQKSIQLKPDQNAAYYYLGLVAEGNGHNDEAVAILRDLLRRYPDYSPAYEALGTILLKQRDYPRAQEALEKAVLLDPNSVKAHYQLGILLGRIGKQDDADKEFDIMKQLDAQEARRAGVQLRLLTPH